MAKPSASMANRQISPVGFTVQYGHKNQALEKYTRLPTYLATLLIIHDTA